MKNVKITSLESLKNDLFKEQIIEGFNIRGGYGGGNTCILTSDKYGNQHHDGDKQDWVLLT